jgi:hypothetical protein
MVMVLALEVMTVEAALIMKTADGSPRASKVRFVELAKLDPDAYVPGWSVCPPRSKFVSVTAVGMLRSLYATTKSVCAIDAAEFVMLVVPPMVIVPVLVYDVPGNSPMSLPAVPVIVVAPVFVTVDAASTP